MWTAVAVLWRVTLGNLSSDISHRQTVAVFWKSYIAPKLYPRNVKEILKNSGSMLTRKLSLKQLWVTCTGWIQMKNRLLQKMIATRQLLYKASFPRCISATHSLQNRYLNLPYSPIWFPLISLIPHQSQRSFKTSPLFLTQSTTCSFHHHGHWS